MEAIGQSQLCCFLAGSSSIYASFWDFGFLRICTKFHHQPFLESGCLDNLTPGPFSNLLLESSAKHFEQLLWASEPSALLWSLGSRFISFKLWLAPKSRYNVYGDIHIRFRSRRAASHLWLKMIECRVRSCLLMVLDSTLNWDCRFG